MSAVVDRSACRPWCGMSAEDIHGTPLAKDYIESADFTAGVVGNLLRWCSSRCRDLRLPPVASTIPVADARGEGACDPGPMTALRGKSGTPARDERSVSAGGLSASPVNVSPAPAVGQRWRHRNGDVDFDTVPARSGTATVRLSLKVARNIHGAIGEVFEHFDWDEFFGHATYLGSTPPPSPAPATPDAAPVSPPAVAASGCRPPLSYMPCPSQGCRNWMAGNQRSCWTCFGEPSSQRGKDRKIQQPDWTPPADAKPVTKPKAPAGIKCARCLCTSERGDVHMESCTRSDFRALDASLTSEQWSAQVRLILQVKEDLRERRERPFVPSVTDEDLFGKSVRR